VLQTVGEDCVLRFQSPIIKIGQAMLLVSSSVFSVAASFPLLSLSLSHGFTSIYFSVLTPSLYFSMFFTEIFNFAASLTSYKLDFVPMELKIVNKLKELLVS
jgi:hypothetical protein